MNARTLRGSIPALATPFDSVGNVDAGAFTSLVEGQVERGSHAVVVYGSTGEVATMTSDEREGLVHLCVHAVRGRVPVVAGIGVSERIVGQRLNLARTSIGVA